MGMAARAEEMRALDRRAIQDYHIPSLELMERAAQGVAEAVLELLEPESSQTNQQPRVGVLCGPGNNGGDGVAAARLLLEAGLSVRAFLVGDRAKMTPDQGAMEARLVQAGGNLEAFMPQDREQILWLEQCDLLIDALFGIGLSRPVQGEFRAAVELLQDGAGRRVVSCDIPSGVQADTGTVLGAAVRAGVTVTFTCAKPGHYLGDGAEHTGVLRVTDIGIPRALLDELRKKDPVQITESVTLPRRRGDSHKGDYGRLLLLAGSEGYTGAPVLAASAAVRSGAGLVFLGVPREIYPIVAVKCSSAMPFPLPEGPEGPDQAALLERARGCDAVLMGPGLGRGAGTDAMVRGLLARLDCPVVLDADGINALAGHIDILDRRRALTVLTPHDGEFARLTGGALPLEDRLEAARRFAADHRCVLVLKGHRTITAGPEGQVWINSTGNPGMAKGGSGDALAGLLAALLGQRQLREYDPDPAALAARGVWLHGAARSPAAAELGEYGMTPDDLIARLPQLFRDAQEPPA